MYFVIILEIYIGLADEAIVPKLSKRKMFNSRHDAQTIFCDT